MKIFTQLAAICTAGGVLLMLSGCGSGDKPGSASVDANESEKHIPGKTAPAAGPGGSGRPGAMGGMPGAPPGMGGSGGPPNMGPGGMPGGGPPR